MIIILVLLMILVLKNYQSHNMILMSKYKGKHGGKKGSTNSGRGLPPPFSGNARKKFFFYVRASLTLVFCLIETFLESLCSFTLRYHGYFFLHQSAQYFTFLNLCGEVRTRSGKEVVVRARNEKRSRSTVGSNSLRCASSLRSRLVYSWDCI